MSKRTVSKRPPKPTLVEPVAIFPPAPAEDVLKRLRCLSVVMPVFNEAATIKPIIGRVLSVPLPKELIIVDDCSTDGTRQILQQIADERTEWEAKYPGSTLKVLFHKTNQGKGAALRTGIAECTGDITIVQDADLEYDPSEYPRVIEPILCGDADVVYGSRFRGERTRIHLFWHQLGNKGLTLVSNVFTNLNLTDMETCYKAFKTGIIQSIPLRSDRFGFEPEVTAKLGKLRCVIYEVPISYRGRSYAEGKKINWKDGLSAVYTIVKYAFVEDLFKDDSGHHTLRIMEGAGEYNGWLFEQCKPYLGRRVVEVGCGVGNITKFLLGSERLVATDLNELYLDDLRRTYAAYDHVHLMKFNLLDETAALRIKHEHAPDTVLSMNVLEHVEDDVRAMENVGRTLPEGGRVVLVVPAHARLYSDMDKNLGHYRRYTQESLRKVLEQAGFEVESTRYINMLGALGWFVNGRIFRRGIIPSRQLRVFDLVSPILKMEQKMAPPFGISVLAVATKR